MDLKFKINELARSQGASMVGVAPVDRFVGAPEGHGPTDFVKYAKSVIVVGIKIPNPIAEYTTYAPKFRGMPPWASVPFSTDDWITLMRENTYALMGHYTLDVMLCIIATRIALMLEELGYSSMPTPCAGDAGLGMPRARISVYFSPFSQRHAAVRAGLGEFGLSNIVVTPEFGPRVRFVSVITEALLEPDPLVSEKICLRDKCDARGPRCLRACIAGAIELLDGIDQGAIFVDTPSKTDARLCHPNAETAVSASTRPSCIYYGECMRSCPVGVKLSQKKE